VQWVPATAVRANDYNPNSVALPEMELLRLSIESDGFTQPIVVWEVEPGTYEVVDGFHRHKVGKAMGLSHLPVVIINGARTDRGDRIASTIRHNRARGKHAVNSMSEIVIELARRNWSDNKIGKELGMEPDEVLRLKQIKGLEEMFANREFSEAWEAQ
jgi:ParB-like chromosome segregation protein Spo0J